MIVFPTVTGFEQPPIHKRHKRCVLTHLCLVKLAQRWFLMLFPYPSNLAEWEPWAPFFKACTSNLIISKHLSCWWLNQPIWKIWVKMGIFPRDENKNIWNLPTNTILFNQHQPEFTSTAITAPKIHPAKTLPVAPRFLQWQWCQIAWLDGECITLSGAKMQARWELKQGWTFGQIDVMLYEKTRI